METEQRCATAPSPIKGSSAIFSLGRVVATPMAIRLLQERDTGALSLLLRHQCGDWGKVHPEDGAANDTAIVYGGRILSCYDIVGERIWIITEADRSVTTLLLPEEY
ncbi:hypothetical protein [Bordetella sp. LUAb4]|uniref:hypothetical protein n=1 Tax=Bordetella sp. LUAb4 TaxID=2843195 RepID=UPI001E2C9391|nr:hypothetical protein [Bordetella sp. LUAb4]